MTIKIFEKEPYVIYGQLLTQWSVVKEVYSQTRTSRRDTDRVTAG